jgi:tellurite resistance protein TehA-like permease
MGDPYKNMTIFPIIGSLAMSANVLWAPIGFFVPQISSGLQSLMLPSLAFWGVLWIMMFVLEFNVAKTWLKHKIEIDKFNFVWLLDVFAFGLVSLAGSGVAGTSGNPQISGIAVIGTLVTVAVGILLLSAKLINLIKPMIKGKDLPAVPILPAYFILVPITCLFGISIFRLTSYFQKVYSYDLSSLLSVIVVLAYVFSMTWLVFTVYLLGNYFKNLFKRSEYSAPQWSMVCALVGSQVLGVYAHSLYIKSPILYAINFISIIMAAAIYIFIFMKFMKVLSPVSNSAS